MTTDTTNVQCPSVASLAGEKHDLSDFALQAALLKSYFPVLGNFEWEEDTITEERHQWSVEIGDTNIAIGVTEINMRCLVVSPTLNHEVTIPHELCTGDGINGVCMAKTLSRLIENVPHLTTMAKAALASTMTAKLINLLLG
jgi:exosome complex RNA-binding protein Rrp42 (RNase PH superfamily)